MRDNKKVLEVIIGLLVLIFGGLLSFQIMYLSTSQEAKNPVENQEILTEEVDERFVGLTEEEKGKKIERLKRDKEIYEELEKLSLDYLAKSELMDILELQEEQQAETVEDLIAINKEAKEQMNIVMEDLDDFIAEFEKYREEAFSSELVNYIDKSLEIMNRANDLSKIADKQFALNDEIISIVQSGRSYDAWDSDIKVIINVTAENQAEIETISLELESMMEELYELVEKFKELVNGI